MNRICVYVRPTTYCVNEQKHGIIAIPSTYMLWERTTRIIKNSCFILKTVCVVMQKSLALPPSFAKRKRYPSDRQKLLAFPQYIILYSAENELTKQGINASSPTPKYSSEVGSDGRVLYINPCSYLLIYLCVIITCPPHEYV